MTYKELFQFASTKLDYKIFHGRILGVSYHTSAETKTKDAVQEMGLLSKWLRDEHKINVIIEVDETSYLKYSYKIVKYIEIFKFETERALELFLTFEEAQLEGLYLALNKIKK